ncbi:XdhC family protein [Exilibacterium tricleocarpae]|uniref:XdhC family protein n=1 Tax=Exilibacterium tricleocarpae TaxID=2591008 RepID=A0A545SMF7_9GAMM|nr:XdhC family protein [Exilibacterium tricleocarpae]TQV66141.1 XdhC family protein [Exilibacterium tricleocarpae]
MNYSQLAVLQQALKTLESGCRVTLATVTRTWGSSPRPPGAMLAVADDGQFYGSVSGGCIEEDLLARLAAAPVEAPEVVSYGGTAEQSERYGLPCGGTLELVLEPMAPQLAHWRQVVAVLERRESVCRTLALSSGSVELGPAGRGDETRLDNGFLKLLLGPVWRLLIIGAAEPSRYLAEMAQALGYQVSVCDPRPEYTRGWNLSHTRWMPGMPDDAVTAMDADERTAIVALTHDPRLDDMALLEALQSPAFYVGALGSVRTNSKRRQRLAEHFGFSPQQLQRLHGPVGLDIGSKTPAEIAVAIVAELVALRHGKVLIAADSE